MNEKKILLAISKIRSRITSMNVAADQEDFEFLNKETDKLFELLDDFEKSLIDDLKSVKQFGGVMWRDPNEILPEDREDILFTTISNQVFEGFYDKCDDVWFRYRFKDFLDSNLIVAWSYKPCFSRENFGK